MNSQVCVVGTGVIGIPTGLHIGKYYDVIGFDINLKAVEHAIKNGLTSTNNDLPHADIYVLAVTTSINSDDTPNMSSIYTVCENISKINPNALICIESTISIGTCRKISEKYSLDNIVHCPHRFWEGDTENYGIVQTRAFGALNEKSHKMGKAFYETQQVPIIEVSSIETAEMCKITENAYRFVEIAFAEELHTICTDLGVSFEELRNAANTKWNINILEARDGIGGHCLPKDVRYLYNIQHSPLLHGAIKADKIYKKLNGKNI